jgi:hypothetical protein
MSDEQTRLWRVLRSSTAAFSVGCPRPQDTDGETMPEFGALVKVVRTNGDIIYGLIHDVRIEDDAFVRQLVAAAVNEPEIIEDQRQKRQVPIEVSVLAVGHGRDLDVYHRLPPQPPGALDDVIPCNAAEMVRFSERQDWLRLVLAAPNVPAEQLIGAALRRAALARPPDQRNAYLVGAGRELARLLADNLVQLDGILRQLHL